MALAVESGFIEPEDHIALLGIGSGINSLMLAIDWQRSLQPLSQAAGLPQLALQG